MEKRIAKSIPKLKEIAQTWFNRFIRLRDTDENGFGRCISCGKTTRFGDENYHACHYYNTKNYGQIRYDEDNCHGGCKKCNRYLYGNLIEYRKMLLKKIGEERLRQLDLKSEMCKKSYWKQDEFYYTDIISIYNKKCKELEKSKQF